MTLGNVTEYLVANPRAPRLNLIKGITNAIEYLHGEFIPVYLCEA
jgi:hypothetical protein